MVNNKCTGTCNIPHKYLDKFTDWSVNGYNKGDCLQTCHFI